jgi:hypothetical protein
MLMGNSDRITQKFSSVKFPSHSMTHILS